MKKLIAFLGIYFYGDHIPVPFMHMVDSPPQERGKREKATHNQEILYWEYARIYLCVWCRRIQQQQQQQQQQHHHFNLPDLLDQKIERILENKLPCRISIITISIPHDHHVGNTQPSYNLYAAFSVHDVHDVHGFSTQPPGRDAR